MTAHDEEPKATKVTKGNLEAKKKNTYEGKPGKKNKSPLRIQEIRLSRRGTKEEQ